MPARAFLLRVRGKDYPQHLVQVDPVANPTPEMEVTPGGFADLRVVDGEDRGVAGATVTAFPSGEFPYDTDFDATRRSLQVEAEGKRRIRMCTGPRRLRAETDDGRRSQDVLVTIREGETTPVTLVLREATPSK